MPKWIKFGGLFAAFASLLVYASLGSAQAPPDGVINPILNDLGQRVGRQIGIDDLVNYSWRTGIFNNEAIGCPSPDQTYTRSFVEGYIVTIYYGNLYWDYRYDAGRSSFFLCNNPNLDNLRLPVTATPTSQPTATPAPVQAQATALPETNPIPPLQQTAQAPVSANPPINSNPPANLVEETLPCPQALTGGVPSRLAVGLTGQFVGSSNQNIHAQASRTSEVLGITTLGGSFSILAGPECDRTFTWWQVDTAGLIGWVGEVNPSDLSYWLQATGGTASTSPSVAPPANNTPSAISLEAPLIDELARQSINDPEKMIVRASTANPEGAVFIAGSTGLQLYSNTAPSSPIAQIYDLPILDFALSKDGSRIFAIVNENGTPALRFASSTGESIGEAPLNANFVRGMVLIDDLNLMALGGENAVLLYDLGSNQVVAELSLNALPLQMALSPASNVLAVLLPNEARLIDVNTRSEVGRFAVTLGQNSPDGLAFSPDGLRLAVGEGGSANIYSLNTFEAVLALPVFFDASGEVDSIAFSPNGQLIATAGNLINPTQSTRLMVWDAQTGGLVAVMGGILADQQIRSIAFSPSGDLLNAVSRENSWQIWSVRP